MGAELNLCVFVEQEGLLSEKFQRRCESRRTWEKRSGKVRTLDARAAAQFRLKISVLNQRPALR
jgi:hypothetical protein